MKSEEAVRLLTDLGACGFPGEKAVQMSRFANYAEAWDSWPVEWVADRFWLLFRVAGKYGSTSNRFACGVLGECLRPSLRRATTLGSQARRAVNRVSRLLCRYARGEDVLRSDFAEAEAEARATAKAEARVAAWAEAKATRTAARVVVAAAEMWAAAAWVVVAAAKATRAAAEARAVKVTTAESAEKAESMRLTEAILHRVSADWLERRLRATSSRKNTGAGRSGGGRRRREGR